MKKRRKNQRKASSRQCAAKRFVARIYLHIAYYLQVTRYGIAQIVHHKSLTLDTLYG